jgi:hypothetical protein
MGRATKYAAMYAMYAMTTMPSAAFGLCRNSNLMKELAGGAIKWPRAVPAYQLWTGRTGSGHGLDRSGHALDHVRSGPVAGPTRGPLVRMRAGSFAKYARSDAAHFPQRIRA